jgi:hypothetical protein
VCTCLHPTQKLVTSTLLAAPWVPGPAAHTTTGFPKQQSLKKKRKKKKRKKEKKKETKVTRAICFFM